MVEDNRLFARDQLRLDLTLKPNPQIPARILDSYYASEFCMDPFDPLMPTWTQSAVHAIQFCCPTCSSLCTEAQRVWINRRSPVFTEDHRRKWQEFYQCQCNTIWWAWSSDRPPSDIKQPDIPPPGDQDWPIF